MQGNSLNKLSTLTLLVMVALVATLAEGAWSSRTAQHDNPAPEFKLRAYPDPGKKTLL